MAKTIPVRRSVIELQFYNPGTPAGVSCAEVIELKTSQGTHAWPCSRQDLWAMATGIPPFRLAAISGGRLAIAAGLVLLSLVTYWRLAVWIRARRRRQSEAGQPGQAVIDSAVRLADSQRKRHP